MYITRDLEDRIKKYLTKPEIIAVIGPRQSGKTTLLKRIFSTLKDAVYLDFEDRDTLGLFNNDIKSFYNLYAKNAKFLFIDEFQYAKYGGQKLKYLYDTYKTKIIISGSSALDLTHQTVKYLVGRILIFQLFPFNFKEYLSYRNPALYENIYLDIKDKIEGYIYNKKKSPSAVSVEAIKEINKYYQEYVVFGGYPRVALAKDTEEKITVLKNIYSTYFLREIRDILQLSSEEELDKLIKVLALQAGSMVVYNELCQASGLNYSSLVKHLNILEKTFVISKLLPFCKNKRVEIVKNPKMYFLDNGFRNMAVNNFQPLKERPDRGALNENFVAAELVKNERRINYWRTKSAAEMDFVIENKGKLIGIEVKSILNSNKAGKSVMSFMGKYPVSAMLMLSENYSFFDKKRNIFFMPVFFI